MNRTLEKIRRDLLRWWKIYLLASVIAVSLVLYVESFHTKNIILFGLFAGIAYRLMSQAAGSVTGWFFRVKSSPAFLELDEQLAKRFALSDSLNGSDYHWIVGYFATGIAAYRSPGCAHVLYPGLPGTYGLQVEGLEGFARSAPLLASWIRKNGDWIPLPGGGSLNAFEHLKMGIVNGTNPDSDEYWGDIGDLDQRVVEAGDIALAIWILDERLIGEYEAAEVQSIFAWLRQAQGKKLYGGNWHLFPLIIALVLSSFGDETWNEVDHHYSTIKKMYLGGGWFNEGRQGRVDHYNAWQLAYFLYFVDKVSPDFDPDFIRSAIKDFSAGYQFWFSPSGFPISGRSMSYRMAVPTPLILSSSFSDSPISLGKARRALDTTWIYFIQKGSLRYGLPTQGYEEANPSILENYSGRGSSLWSVRSLTAAFWISAEVPFWEAAPAPLEIEKRDYEVNFREIGVRVIGEQATRRISVIFEENIQESTDLEEMAMWRKIAQVLLRRPMRPDNYKVKYFLHEYRSDDTKFR